MVCIFFHGIKRSVSITGNQGIKRNFLVYNTALQHTFNLQPKMSIEYNPRWELWEEHKVHIFSYLVTGRDMVREV